MYSFKRIGTCPKHDVKQFCENKQINHSLCVYTTDQPFEMNNDGFPMTSSCRKEQGRIQNIIRERVCEWKHRLLDVGNNSSPTRRTTLQLAWGSDRERDLSNMTRRLGGLKDGKMKVNYCPDYIAKIYENKIVIIPFKNEFFYQMYPGNHPFSVGNYLVSETFDEQYTIYKVCARQKQLHAHGKTETGAMNTPAKIERMIASTANENIYEKKSRVLTWVRKALIRDPVCTCSLCHVTHLSEIIELAHIKSYNTCTIEEKKDLINLIPLCRNCHKYFDEGIISVNDMEIQISPQLNHNDIRERLKEFLALASFKEHQQEYLKIFNGSFDDNVVARGKYFKIHFDTIFRK